MTRERFDSQLAWDDFLERLREIGDKIVGVTGAKGPRERAEGFRYLMGLLSAGQDLEMEVDGAHPRLTRMFTPMRSFIADGVDTLYHEAKIDVNRSYVCKIERGDDIFFSIVVYASDDEGMREMSSFLIDDDIHFEGNAATIHISKERPAGAQNWLALSGHDPFVLTRQYFPESVVKVDEGSFREATMSIHATPASSAPPAYDLEVLSSGLDRVVAFMQETVDSALGISAYVALNMIEYEGSESTPTRIDASGKLIVDEERHDSHTADEIVDMIDPKVVANNLPGPGIGYVGASYKLADDEAILVEGQKIPCRYWSCQLLDHFLRSGDYRYHVVSLNDRQIDYDSDGSFRIYASRNDPGVRNWLDTQGRRRGQVVLRTLLAETDMDPALSVIKIADIPDRDRR
ncbi:MAG: DUF1214 domain-containing protein [Polyangiales bacterium]